MVVVVEVDGNVAVVVVVVVVVAVVVTVDVAVVVFLFFFFFLVVVAVVVVVVFFFFFFLVVGSGVVVVVVVVLLSSGPAHSVFRKFPHLSLIHLLLGFNFMQASCVVPRLVLSPMAQFVKLNGAPLSQPRNVEAPLGFCEPSHMG